MIPTIILTALVMCSGSMEPYYSCGDRVILEPEFNLTINETYIYWNYDHYTMHRLIRIQNDTLTFKGDNNWYSEKVHISKVKWKVGAKI